MIRNSWLGSLFSINTVHWLDFFLFFPLLKKRLAGHKKSISRNLMVRMFYFLFYLVLPAQSIERYPEWDKWSGIERHGNHDVNYTEMRLAGWVSSVSNFGRLYQQLNFQLDLQVGFSEYLSMIDSLQNAETRLLMSSEKIWTRRQGSCLKRQELYSGKM